MANMNDFLVELITTLNTSQAINDINKFKKELEKKNINLKAVLDTSASKQELQNFAVQLQKILNEKGINIDTSKILSSLNQVSRQVETVASKANKIQSSLNNGDYDTKILAYKTSLEKLGLSVDEIATKMEGANTALTKLKSSATGDNIISNEVVDKAQTLETEMSKLSNTVKQIKLNDSLKADDLKVDNTIIRLNEQLRKNTAYSKSAKEQIRAWIAELEKGNVAEARLREINTEAKKLHVNMAQVNKIGFSGFDKLKQGMDSFKSWLSATSIVMSGISTARKMASAVYDIDTAMTELDKVSDSTLSELNRSLEKSTETAKKYGAAVDEVINATADWSRLGYDLPDAEYLAEVATIYKNVGDGIDIDTANQSLESTLQGFQLDADEALSIIDKFNEVANNFPIDTAGIGEALQRSAASFYAANTDLSKSIALITGTNSVVQDPDSVGKYIVPTFTVMCC